MLSSPVTGPAPAATDAQAAEPAPRTAVPWRTLAGPSGGGRAGRRGGDGEGPSTRRVVLQVAVSAALVIALVAGGSVVLARRIAEREAVNAAAQVTDILAESVVQAALEDSLLSDDPEAARARLDSVVRERVLAASGVVRVKLWSAQGEVVYSDEARLVGRSYGLQEDERAVLLDPRTEAEVTDLQEPENVYERGQGKLLEVYRPVWTPDGTPLLFETYTRYAQVSERMGQVWRSFAGVLVSSLLLLVVLLTPVLWALLDRLRRGQRAREALLQDAVDASAQERRRIAAALHDGVVQELTATSFAVSAAAAKADSLGDPHLAGQLHAAAAAVRGGMRGLRSLLVDIYPPSLSSAGLAPALADLADEVRPRGMSLELDLPPLGQPSGLDTAGEQLVFRVALETVRNAVAHSGAATVGVRLALRAPGAVLEVSDDGAGFDPDDAAHEGHFGLRLLPDLARQGGATLELATAPGAGTRWRLEVPSP